MKVRAIEFVTRDGVFRISADGTPGYLSVTCPSGRSNCICITAHPNGENEKTIGELAWDLIACDQTAEPTAKQIARVIALLSSVVW